VRKPPAGPGLDLDFLDHIEQLGLVRPADDGAYAPGQVRRAQLVELKGVAGALRLPSAHRAV
jgi:hypothetical protein